MEGVIFLVCWLGCSLLHTLYDLKIKPLIQDHEDERETFLK